MITFDPLTPEQQADVERFKQKLVQRGIIGSGSKKIKSKPRKKNAAEKAYFNKVNELDKKERDPIARLQKKTRPPAADYYRLDIPRPAFAKATMIAMRRRLRGGPNGPTFIPEPEFTSVMSDLIDYFLVLPGAKYGPEKGLFLWGTTGVGKTLMLQTFHLLFDELGIRQRFNWAVMRSIGYELMETSSVEQLGKYFRKSYAFDDLGFEEQNLKIYGSSVNIGREILTKRYEAWKDNPLHRTYLTTNLLPPDLTSDNTPNITDIYGDRIASRVSEMFHFIRVDGKDKRR